MIKLKTLQIPLTVITISILLFLIPFESHSDNLDDWNVPEYQQMRSQDSSIMSKFNFISTNVQYQIRDISDGLVCIVQSDTITIFDSKLTFDHLSNHPSRTTFENNGVLINYVILKDYWNVGPGDSFLSALKYIVTDPVTEKPYSLFFATTNGCAVQPGDKVSVIWEVVFN
tara:strand:+ start:60 stop:572 length:513 start_codon:yes stop_codon:yes gene_type:complete